MLQVAYFSNHFANQQGHGLARHARELFHALDCEEGLGVTPVASWSDKSPADLSSLGEQTGLRILPLGRRLTPLCWTFLGAPPIETWLADEPDVVHAVSMGYPIATRKPLVVTVHDLGPLTHPQYFERSSPWIMKQSLRQTINQASAIICVSKSTADELVALAGKSVASKIEVIHLGVAETFLQAAGAVSIRDLPDMPPPDVPYILATGKLSPRKNVQGLVRALASIAADIPHHLVLVGGDGWSTQEIYRTLRESGIANRVHLPGYVSDEQLRALYERACVYVHPSLYEGFGLTVLEAMAAGCPVITSNVYSLPEVAGDAALLVDPESVSALAGAMRRVCQDNALAEQLRQAGIARASQFSWERCASSVAQVYQQVAR